MKNYDYAILIISVFLILIIIWYYNVKTVDFKIKYVEGNVSNYKAHNSTKLRIFNIVNFDSQHKFKLTNNDAIVFITTVNNQYDYFSINGYIYDIPSNNSKDRIKILSVIPNPISNFEFHSIPYGTVLIKILTKNKLFYNEIEQKLFREFKKSHVKIFPILIPTKFNNIDYTYTIISEVMLKNESVNIPTYKTRFYSCNDIKMYNKHIEIPEKNIYSSFSELDIISLEKWKQKCLDIAKIENFNIIEKINTYFCKNSIQCIEQQIYCKENNDAISFFATNSINLNISFNSIQIIAVDHTISGLAMYSCINIYNDNEIIETFVTGDNTHNKIDNKKIFSKILTPNKLYENIRIEEHIFINCETRYGPDINTILPMQVYVCLKN